MSPRLDQPFTCTILVEGQIGQRWFDWFDGMELSSAGAQCTCLTGRLQDQAALLGLLQRLYSLGFPILKVEVETL